MSNKEKILDLYYNQHLKQNEIAKLVGTTAQYVSKVVRADKRNKEEKEKRKIENSENRKVYMQEYFKTYNRPKKDDNSYEQMVAQQIQDSFELSFSNNIISNYDYAKWNSFAYHTNSKGNLVLNRNLKVGFDVPKSINMNIKVPTQKYKNRYVYSY
jgi:transcriptional regulator with XRE-family HTH domain